MPGTAITIKHGDQKYIVLAVDPLNSSGRSQGSYSSGMEALEGLWKYLGNKSDKTSVALPLLGTGRARVANLCRAHATKRILKSFASATSVKAFCNELAIYIHPDDFVKNSWSLDETEEFASHIAAYQREATLAGLERI